MKQDSFLCMMAFKARVYLFAALRTSDLIFLKKIASAETTANAEARTRRNATRRSRSIHTTHSHTFKKPFCFALLQTFHRTGLIYSFVRDGTRKGGVGVGKGFREEHVACQA